MAYEICKDCVDMGECNLWPAVEKLKKQLFGGCPFKAMANKKIKYVITHNDGVLHTLSSEYPAVAPDMINLMVLLSGEKAGVFILYSVEIDPETGREKSTQIACAINGREI